jgi:ATP-binding cassette subfamily B protein RaxB
VNLLVDSVNRGVRTEKFMLGFGIASTAVFGVESLTVLWLRAGKVIDGAMTVGMLLAFISYGGQFGGRMSALTNRFMEFRLLSVHAERLADILLEPIEQEGCKGLMGIELTPRIELVDVSFRYAENEPWIIRHLTLTIEAWRVSGIGWPFRGGKTTLVKLILGILKPTEGELHLGGYPLSLLGTQALRQAMAAVMQDDHLLAGSLAENISFFDPQPQQGRIELCARMAAIHDDIAAMPMGYHTFSGDMGTTLSGGQKQRILLARALYKSPKIIILDEATSHLDVLRERQVNHAIGALAMTRICVAHRPETIAMSGRVIQLGGDTAGHFAQPCRLNNPKRGSGLGRAVEVQHVLDVDFDFVVQAGQCFAQGAGGGFTDAADGDAVLVVATAAQDQPFINAGVGCFQRRFSGRRAGWRPVTGGRCASCGTGCPVPGTGVLGEGV